MRTIAEMYGSASPAATSSRSANVAAGNTMSAWRASEFAKCSWTMIVSGRCHASTRRLRSWWWWNGLPPAQ